MTDARISQVAVEVLSTPTDPRARISQVAVEVLRQNSALKLVCDAGSFSISGKTSSAIYNRGIAASTGSVLINGSDAVLARSIPLQADNTSYLINGNAAAFDYRQRSKLIADGGTFLIGGIDAGYKKVTTLTAETNVVNITVFNAVLKRDIKEASFGDSYLINGTSAFLYVTRPHNFNFGQFAISGKDSELKYNRVLLAEAGGFAVSGSAMTAAKKIIFKAAGSSFAISGNDAKLSRPHRAIVAQTAEYHIGMNYGYPYKHVNGPFFFAWANKTDRVFSPHHRVYDESIFSFKLTHEEGQCPTLDVEIKNPRRGLLNTNADQWAWFSWYNGNVVVPLFYGRLVGVPNDLLGEVITLQFVARSSDYVSQKRRVADSLKTRPYYDPVFLSEQDRDDPDKILEAYARSWHVDRTTLSWSTSDIITGEDGLDEYQPSDAFYDSVRISIGQPPLKSLSVRASCSWDQLRSGVHHVGSYALPCLNAGLIAAQWPQSGTSLGDGWVVEEGWGRDLIGAPVIGSKTEQSSYSNQNTSHAEGDLMSYSWSATRPTLDGKVIMFNVDPDNIKQTSSGYTYNFSKEYTPPGYFVGALSVRYEATRPFDEEITINLEADLQPLLFDIDAEQESETVDLSIQSLTDPIRSYTDWYSISGVFVQAGQIITDRYGVYHVAIQGGTTNTVNPVWASIPGDTTQDGDVVWACLGKDIDSGAAQANGGISGWSPNTQYSLGAIVEAQPVTWQTYAQLTSVGYYDASPVSVAFGTVIRTDNGASYQRCIQEGKTAGGRFVPAFSSTVGVTVTDGSVIWESLGVAQFNGVYPSGCYFLCVGLGFSGTHQPAWNLLPGSVISDGTVNWRSLGASSASISSPLAMPGWTENSNTYFTSDRGLWSVEYMIAVARAKLLTRARAVDVEWETTFARGISLSCRKEAALHDPRLPGGYARGKITSYTLSGDGSQGDFISSIKIGCAVGKDGSISASGGDGVYAAAGYMDSGYQQESGSTSALPASDVGYIPPVFDSGVDYSIGGNISASMVGGGWGLLGEQVALFTMTVNPIPDKSFSSAYNVGTTKLYIPKQIDLGA